MECKFIFDNFLPTSSTHRYCSRKFQQIWGASPSDSDITAIVVRKADKTFQTIIEISALSGKFKAESNDKTVLVSVGLAVDKIQNSILQKRNERKLETM